MVESYSIVWTRHTYLTHLAVDERLSCFHRLAVATSIDRNTHRQTLECCIQFLWIYTWECSGACFILDLPSGLWALWRQRKTNTWPQGPAQRMPGEQMGRVSSIQSHVSLILTRLPICPHHPMVQALLTARLILSHYFTPWFTLIICSDARSSFPDWGIPSTLLVPKSSFLFLHAFIITDIL